MIQSGAIANCNFVTVFVAKNTNQLIFHCSLQFENHTISATDNCRGNQVQFILFDDAQCFHQSITIMTKISELNICCRFQFQFVAHAATTVIHIYAMSTPKKQNATDISTGGIHLMKKNENNKNQTIYLGESRALFIKHHKLSLVNYVQKKKQSFIYGESRGIRLLWTN